MKKVKKNYNQHHKKKINIKRKKEKWKVKEQ